MAVEKVDIKRINRNRVFRCLLDGKTRTTANISKDLSISLPTAAMHINSLRQENLVLECGLQESTGGRCAKTFACNAGAFVGCGIDITHSIITIVIVDLCGNIVDFEKIMHAFAPEEAYLQMLNSSLSNLLQKNGIPHERVLGLGISLPAIIDGDGRICDTAFAVSLPDNFQAEIQRNLPYRLWYVNDASSGGYAEFWGIRERENLFYLSLSSSVGGAVRIHNRVFDGDDFRSAEIGHVSMVIGGKPCYCGQRGCVNAYCSSDNLSDGGTEGLERFFRDLEAMDADCMRKWDSYLDYLAVAIKNIRMLYDCDVIIGGKVGRYIPRYIPELTRRVQALDSFHRIGDCILPCKYRSKSSAVGAALIHIDRFIENV